MANKKSRGKRSNWSPKPVGFWQMWRDVLIAAMNKGQFPFAFTGFIFIVMILKMPSTDVSKLVFGIFDTLISGSTIGYLIGGLSLTGWFLHSKWQRRIVTHDMKRLARERDKLLRKFLSKDDIRSSEE